MGKQMMYALRSQQTPRLVIVVGYVLAFVALFLLQLAGVNLKSELGVAIVMPIMSVLLTVVLFCPLAWCLGRMSKLLYKPDGVFPMLEPVPAMVKLGGHVLLAVLDVIVIGGVAIAMFVGMVLWITGTNSGAFTGLQASDFPAVISVILVMITTIVCWACGLHAIALFVNRVWPTMRKFGWLWLVGGAVFFYLYTAAVMTPYAVQGMLLGARLRFVFGIWPISAGTMGDTEMFVATLMHSVVNLAIAAGLFVFGAKTLETRATIG